MIDVGRDKASFAGKMVSLSFFGEVGDANGVVEARVVGARVDVVRGAELLEVPQPLQGGARGGFATVVLAVSAFALRVVLRAASLQWYV